MTQTAAALRRLPAAVVPETCKFLDAASLGRLEICGRCALGDGAQAWIEKAAGVTRGNLAQLSNKQLLAAQARVQALIPASSKGAVGFAHNVRRDSEDVPFDEFAFTVVLSWNPLESGDSDFRTTVFPFMRLAAKRNEMGEFSNRASFALFPSGQGADNVSSLLREAAVAYAEGIEFEDFMDFRTPRAYMICTRKADGAAAKVAFWNTDNIDEDDWNGMSESTSFIHGGQCTFRFDYGELMIGHGSSGDYDYHMTLNIEFDQSNGQVIAFCSGVYHSTPDLAGSNMSNEMFLALLHARLDESTRARPMSLSETGRQVLNGELDTSDMAADLADELI